MKKINYLDNIGLKYINIEVSDDVAAALELFEAEEHRDEIAYRKAVKSSENKWYFTKDENEDDLISELIGKVKKGELRVDWERMVAAYPQFEGKIREYQEAHQTEAEEEYFTEAEVRWQEPEDAAIFYERKHNTWVQERKLKIFKECRELRKYTEEEMLEKHSRYHVGTWEWCYEDTRQAWRRANKPWAFEKYSDEEKSWDYDFSYNMMTAHSPRGGEDDKNDPMYQMLSAHDHNGFDNTAYEDNDFGVTEYVYSEKYRETPAESYAARTWTDGQKYMKAKASAARRDGMRLAPHKYIISDDGERVIETKYYTREQWDKATARAEAKKKNWFEKK